MKASVNGKTQFSDSPDYMMRLHVNCGATDRHGFLTVDFHCNPASYNPWPSRWVQPPPPEPAAALAATPVAAAAIATTAIAAAAAVAATPVAAATAAAGEPAAAGRAAAASDAGVHVRPRADDRARRLRVPHPEIGKQRAMPLGDTVR